MINLDAIKHAGVLRGLTDDQRAELATICEARDVGKAEYAFHLGDDADTLYIIQRGLIQLTMPLQVRGAEKEIVTEELSNGDCLAWSALIEPHTLTMSARATTPTKLFGFPRERLLQLFDERPTLGYRLLANLAGVVGRRLHVTKAMWVRELQDHVAKQYG